MNVIEFDQWILKGWMRMQTQLKDAKPRLIQGVLDAEAYSASKQEQIEENKRRRPRTAGERLQRESVSAKGYDTGKSRGYKGMLYQQRPPWFLAKQESGSAGGLLTGKRPSKASVMLLPPTGVLLLRLGVGSPPSPPWIALPRSPPPPTARRREAQRALGRGRCCFLAHRRPREPLPLREPLSLACLIGITSLVGLQVTPELRFTGYAALEVCALQQRTSQLFPTT